MWFDATYGAGNLEDFYEDVVMEACILDEVDVRRDKVKYSLSVREVDGQEVWGKVLLNYKRYPVYKYGDCLRVEGALKDPEVFDGFDYGKYLRRYGVSKVIGNPRFVEKIGQGEGWIFFEWIFKFKGVVEGRLNDLYKEPHSSFLAGLLLGSRKGIPDHLMEDFNRTGLTHIIAISGYNISLIIVIVGSLFSGLSRRWRVFASLIFIFVFTVLVGASAAVVRAAVMGGISLGALYFGRQYDVMRGLFVAAFLMNFWNPNIVLYDVGFQLSFLATMGIIKYADVLMGRLRFLPELFCVRESLAVTFAAQIYVLPLIVWQFGRVSIVSPLANLFVLPLIPWAMLTGFLSLVFGKSVGIVAYLLLEMMICVVKIFAGLSFASLNFIN